MESPEYPDFNARILAAFRGFCQRFLSRETIRSPGLSELQELYCVINGLAGRKPVSPEGRAAPAGNMPCLSAAIVAPGETMQETVTERLPPKGDFYLVYCNLKCIFSLHVPNRAASLQEQAAEPTAGPDETPTPPLAPSSVTGSHFVGLARPAGPRPRHLRAFAVPPPGPGKGEPLLKRRHPASEVPAKANIPCTRTRKSG